MSDNAYIRKRNLQRLCKARGWALKDLPVRFWGRYTYWRDLLNDDRKPFGEKAARRIEEAAQVPRGWLDEPEAYLPAASEPPGVYVITSWPFSATLYLAVKELDAQALGRLEAIIEAYVGKLGARQVSRQ